MLTLQMTNTSPTLIDMITVSLPESAGLLIFGVMLAAAAVILRSLLARTEKAKVEEETVSLAGKQNG